MGNAHWGGSTARIDADAQHVYIALQWSGKVGFYRVSAQDGQVVPFTWNQGGRQRSEIDHIAYTDDQLAGYDTDQIPHVWDALHNGTLGVEHALHADRQLPGNLSGVAVGPNHVVIAMYPDNKLLVADKHSARHVREIRIDRPAGIDFSTDGRHLYVISDGELVRMNITGTNRTVLVSRDSGVLDQPVEITAGADGLLYVSDWGAAMQVKVLSSNGQLQQTVGKAGGRAIHGPYDPGGMLCPMGVAVDANGMLWVSEYVYAPKRISVWEAQSGAFEREYLGPSIYGGEGPVVAPWDKTLAFSPGMQFKLDWDQAGYEVTDVFFRAESHKQALFGGPAIRYVGLGGGPAKWGQYPNAGQVIRYEGRTFYLQRAPFPVLYEMIDNIWKPRAALASTHFFARRSYWSDKYILDAIPGYTFSPDGTLPRGGGTSSQTLGARPKDLTEYNLVWVDMNNDGLCQPEEFDLTPLHKTRDATGKHFRWRGLSSIDQDLTLYTRSAKVPMASFTNDGVPVYRMEDTVALPQKGKPLATGDGKLIVLDEPLSGFDADSLALQWTYPNPYNDVRGSHRAPAPHRGQFVGSFNITNDAPLDSGRGRVFHVTGNHGQHFLFTTDGLYVSSLFADSRTGASHPTRNQRGMSLDDTSFTQEGWSGYFWRDEASGNYYAIGGKTEYRIARVEGLTTVQRMPGEAIELTDTQHDHARRLIPQMRDGYLIGVRSPEQLAKAKQSPDELRVEKQQQITIDGSADDWAGSNRATLPITDNQAARVRLGWDDRHLYLFYDVNDDSPWRNSSETFGSLFLHGDAVDLMLRTNPETRGSSATRGDKRLLFGNLKGEPAAVLYDARVPGVDDPVVFVGSKTTTIDVVRQLTDARVAVKTVDHGYTLEAAVPWSELGVSPKAGDTFRGDVGVLLSDRLGNETARRLYRFNADTQAVSDVGSEAMLQPGNWGTLRFE